MKWLKATYLVIEYLAAAISVALGLLVLVRTFLSWSMMVEIDNRWPWQKSMASAEHGG